MTAILALLWLAVLWVSRRHPRRTWLWILDTLLMAVCMGLVSDLRWGRRETALPWRIYVDQSASMSWAGRFARAGELARRLPADVVYFDTEVTARTSGPQGPGTDIDCVKADWRRHRDAYRGIILISDGVFADDDTDTDVPWNLVQVDATEEVRVPALEAPGSVELGRSVALRTDPGARVWVGGQEVPVVDGRARWRAAQAGTFSIFAQLGKGVAERRITVSSPEAPYVLRIIMGVDPAVPAARQALAGYEVQPLQWDGRLWHWRGRTYGQPLWDLWWGQAQWIWLDTRTWSNLAPADQAAIRAQWEDSAIGLYWADTDADLPGPWQRQMPGRKGQPEAWGFQDPDWGPPAWTTSPALADLSLGSRAPGAGFAFHIIGKHRVAQHTGSDWQIALRRDPAPYWRSLSRWLAEGRRPRAEISARDIQSDRKVPIHLLVRDPELDRLEVLIAPSDGSEKARLLPITPDSRQDWRGVWEPRHPGVYHVSVLGHGPRGDWSIEDTWVVPPSSEELRDGQYPDRRAMLRIAAVTHGSYQENALDPAQLVCRPAAPNPYRLRDYPWVLGLAAGLWLLTWWMRIKYWIL